MPGHRLRAHAIRNSRATEGNTMPVRSRTRRGAGSLFSEPAPFQSGTLEIVTPRPVTILGSEERHLHFGRGYRSTRRPASGSADIDAPSEMGWSCLKLRGTITCAPRLSFTPAGASALGAPELYVVARIVLTRSAHVSEEISSKPSCPISTPLPSPETPAGAFFAASAPRAPIAAGC